MVSYQSVPARPSAKFGVCGVAAARWRKGGFASGWLPGRQSLRRDDVITVSIHRNIRLLPRRCCRHRRRRNGGSAYTSPQKRAMAGPRRLHLAGTCSDHPISPRPNFCLASLTTRTLFSVILLNLYGYQRNNLPKHGKKKSKIKNQNQKRNHEI